MSVALGMPSVPSQPVIAPRRESRKIQVGRVAVGGDAPISVQSMCTTLTADVNATLQQIAELTAAGCDIVRVACPSQDDADALADIARKSQIPVIADIHFQPKYVYAAIDAGCAGVRVNPGNIRQFDDQVGSLVLLARHPGVAHPAAAGEDAPHDVLTFPGQTPHVLVLDLPSARHLLDDELGVEPDLDVGCRVDTKGGFETGEQTGILGHIVAGQPQRLRPLDEDCSGSRVTHECTEAGHPRVATRAAVGLDHQTSGHPRAQTHPCARGCAGTPRSAARRRRGPT